MMKLWIYENHISDLWSEELYEWRSLQLYTQLLQLRKESHSCVYNCDDLHLYNSSLCSSHIWFSYIHKYTYVVNSILDWKIIG